MLKKKIDYLELDNIHIVEGDFESTMKSNNENVKSIFSVLIDCDLYKSYLDVLNFVWPKLVNGGYVYFDEYYSLKFAGARIATDEFFVNKKDKPHKEENFKSEFERWGIIKSHEN